MAALADIHVKETHSVNILIAHHKSLASLPLITKIWTLTEYHENKDLEHPGCIQHEK